MTTTLTDSAPKSSCRWLPSVGFILWFTFFIGLGCLSPQVLIGGDGDSCLHWRVGNWMIEHRTIIRQDPFSHTRSGAPVVSKEWLSELVSAATGNLFGWPGIAFLTAASIATTIWLLYRQLLSEGSNALVAAALVLLAGYASSMHWMARPHLVTHLLTVVYCWRLRAYEHDRISRRQLLLPLILLMGLWVNLHGGFFIGLVLIGTHLIGTTWDYWRCSPERRAPLRIKTITLTYLATGSFLVTLLNPNGWQLHVLIFRYLRSPALGGGVNEFLSPDFHSTMARGFLLLLLLLVFVLAIVRPRLPAAEALLVVTWTYFSLHSVRNIPIFALVVTPILGGPLNEYLARFATKGPSFVARIFRSISTNEDASCSHIGDRFYVAIAVLAVVAVLAKPLAIKGAPLLTVSLPVDKFPVEAVNFLQKSPAPVTGNMFNPDDWGSYVMWATPSRKVFIDSRHEFYGEDLIRDYQNCTRVNTNWSQTFAKHEVGWTLLPTSAALNQMLAVHPSWQRVYSDDVATVFTKNP